MGLFDAIKRFLFSPPRPPAVFVPPRAPAPASEPVRPRPAPTQVKRVTLNLDAADFAPLKPDQIKQQAAALNPGSWFEFGRRDRIPSTVDPRTKLIDQAMVSHGFITPDELVHIHELGLKMDELRPQKVNAHLFAEQAVAQDSQARKELKEQKKRDAEQRKLDRAQQIQARRATDIIHLGRGVSAGLADRRSNIEKLSAQGLPVLSTPLDVANALGIDIPRLRWLAFHSEASAVSHYIRFSIPKKSGGERLIFAPHKQLATAQRWILEHILRKLSPHSAAHGFVPSRSILTNAQPHIAARVVVNCDLKDFFPSITIHRVIGYFKHVGYSPAVATILALLTTECPRREVRYDDATFHVAIGPRGLPQGACTSPDLSNLITRRLDSRLSGIARKLDWSYTRYADDLSFSKRSQEPKTAYLLARIRHIAQDEGFVVNEDKTRVLKTSARQSVTGVVVNQHASTPRQLRRQLRAILHNASKTSLREQNRQRQENFPAHLRGMVGFVAMVNPRQGAALKTALNRVAPPSNNIT
jgi:RNA-directed DNA polymerase